MKRREIEPSTFYPGDNVTHIAFYSKFKSTKIKRLHSKLERLIVTNQNL